MRQDGGLPGLPSELFLTLQQLFLSYFSCDSNFSNSPDLSLLCFTSVYGRITAASTYSI